MKKKRRLKNLARDDIARPRQYPREHYNANHTPKKAYETLEQAREAVEYYTRNGTEPGLNAYRCTVCGKWHIGHTYHLNTEMWLDLQEAREACKERMLTILAEELNDVRKQINIISAKLKQFNPNKTKRL